MIDSHCHLDHEPILSNLSEILVRSKNIGIEKLLTICTTEASFVNILKLIEKDSIIYGTYGIHPHETSTDSVSKDEIIKNVKNNKKIIAIGESGLDFYYNHSDHNKQISSFKTHIEASIDLDIPVIVHSRSAEKETYDILKDYIKHKPKILMHCFTGSTEFARKLLTLESFFFC